MKNFFGSQSNWNFTDWGTLASKSRSISNAFGLLIGSIVVTFGFTGIIAILSIWFKRNFIEYMILAFIRYGFLIYGVYFISAYLLFSVRKRRLQPLLGRVYTLEQMQLMSKDINDSGIHLNQDEQKLLESLNNQTLTVSSRKQLKQLLNKINNK